MRRRVAGSAPFGVPFALTTAIVLFALGATALPAQSVQPDPWAGGTDLHFLAGVAGGLVTATLVENFLPTASSSYPLFAPATSLYAATVAGIGKELLDSTGFGTPDFPDILFTAAGGVVAGAIVSIVGGLFPPAHQSDRNAIYLSTATLLSIPVALGAVREVERYLGRRAGKNP